MTTVSGKKKTFGRVSCKKSLTRSFKRLSKKKKTAEVFLKMTKKNTSPK